MQGALAHPSVELRGLLLQRDLVPVNRVRRLKTVTRETAGVPFHREKAVSGRETDGHLALLALLRGRPPRPRAPQQLNTELDNLEQDGGGGPG
jgi:hypothetical protein